MSWLAWDLETGIKAALKRKASPFYGLNQIWAVGYGQTHTTGTLFYRDSSGLPSEWFRDMLKQCKILVGFNIKFDLLHALQEKENHRAWMRWVAGGGLVWDCQLAEYLLQGMDKPWHMCSMDETAPLYGGSMKDDAVKACWNNGVDTPDIDRDMLCDYLMGTGEDNLGDIGNTAKIFLGQYALAKERGQLKSIVLNNGALLYTVEAELNGMKIAVEKAEKLREGLVKRLEEVSAKVNEYLPKDLPFEFNWGSPAQKSALLFGGTIMYDSREQHEDEDGNLMYAQMSVTQYILKDGTTKPESEMTELDWLRVGRYAGGKQKGMPKTKKVKVNDPSKPKMHTVKRPYKFYGFVQPLKSWATSTEGQYKTGSEVVEELGKWVDAPPFIKDYAEQAKISKDLSTYYWVEDAKTGERKGMMALLGPDGIIHHQLNMVNTVTARLSSSDPNLQNIPKGDKSDVKTVFVSRFPNGSIIQSDFTALEVYVQGNLSLDKNLLADLRSGMDMHCKRVSQKEGVDYLYVLERAKNEDHPEHKEWKYKRTKAKEFSFQRAYGAGAAAIAASTGMSVDDVKALIAAEEKMYPGVLRFNESVARQLKQNRKPTKVYNTHSIVKQPVNFGKSWFKTPDGKRYVMWESEAPEWLYKQDGTLLSFKPTTIQNYPVQGTGGEWAKAAMWLMVRAFYAEENFGGLALIVNQVHDAVYVDTDESVRIEAMALTHACMQEASVLMEQHFDWKIAVPVPTETTYGPSMADEKGAPAEVFDLVPRRRAQLRERYLKNYIPSFEQEKAA
ncbi:DNA polymerase [Stenotrophomonas phage Stm18]